MAAATPPTLMMGSGGPAAGGTHPTGPSIAPTNNAGTPSGNGQQQPPGTMNGGFPGHLIPYEGPMVQRVPLSRLVDHAIQKTYHDLTVLTELLPLKSDMERKIEIITYASRARQTFIRILALVKWASSASKVDKCMSILQFLDKQSALFTETADTLSTIARSTLVAARLPSFQLPAAVEVLTLGTYSKLPTCIRERIVPPDPINLSEKKSTLLRLNHIIEQRLVFSQIPLQMRKDLKIENGRVIFHVEHEFDLCLTVMGDNPALPWRLLWLEILVQDKETGEGKDLVHPAQIGYIEQLIQSRIAADNSKPLQEAYVCIHSFCLSLQLEVLHAQAVGMCFRGLSEFIKIDEYHPGGRLVISYWREQMTSSSAESNYKIIIGYDHLQPEKSLSIVHMPELSAEESQRINSSMRVDNISLENLLLSTTQERSRKLLSQLKNKLKEFYYDCVMDGYPPILQITCLERCEVTERLHISIDNFTGHVICHCPQYEHCPPVDAMEAALSDEQYQKIPDCIDDFRIWLLENRCRRSVETLFLKYHRTAPFVLLDMDNSQQAAILPPYPSKDKELKQARCVFQFKKYSNYFLVVYITIPNFSTTTTTSPMQRHNMLTVFGNASECCLSSPEVTYYLICTENISDPEYLQLLSASRKTTEDSDSLAVPRSFSKVRHVIELDATEIRSIQKSSKPPRAEFEENADHPIGNTVKRICSSNRMSIELLSIITYTEERLAFMSLSEAFERRGIPHELVKLNQKTGHSAYVITYIPSFNADDELLIAELSKDLVSCRISLVDVTTRIWNVNITFANVPVQSLNSRENGPQATVNSRYEADPGAYEHTLDAIYYDWVAMASLYQVVKRFSRDLQLCNEGSDIGDIGHDLGGSHSSRAVPSLQLSQISDVKSFNYRRIIIGYGPAKSFTVALFWKHSDKKFILCFSTTGHCARSQNPHNLIASQLQHEFNQHKSIRELLMTLNRTLSAMISFSTLSSFPLLGVVISRPAHPVQTFTIIAITSKHIRITYRNTFCLDLTILPDGFIAIRDGAFSSFDRSRALEDLLPIPGFKAFLSKFVDKSATLRRRQSQTEDDNPPSPVSQQSHLPGSGPSATNHSHGPPTSHHMEISMDNFLMAAKVGSPAAPPSVGSNPHTPASPHNSVMGGGGHGPGGYVPSPGGAFSLASPPPHQVPVSSMDFVNSPHHVPSPSLNSPAGPGMMHGPGDMSHASPYATQMPSVPMVSPISGWPASPSISRPSPRPMNPYGYGPHPSPHPPPHPQMPPGQNQAMTNQAASQAVQRVLPQKAWAAAVPIVLTQSGFDQMIRPTQGPHPGQPASESTLLSPLERFLGCIYLKRNLQKELQKFSEFEQMQHPEPGVIAFKTDSLSFLIMLHAITMQSLHMKIQPLLPQQHLIPEEMEILQKYFESKIAGQPHKPDAFLSYCRIITLNATHVQKNFIQLMKLEMMPERNLPNQWTLSLCLTVPPSAPQSLGACGMSAFHNLKGKLLFIIQLSKSIGPNQEQNFVVPFIFDLQANSLVVLPDRSGPPGPSLPNGQPLFVVLTEMLRGFTPHPSNNCMILPALRHIMSNLNL